LHFGEAVGAGGGVGGDVGEAVAGGITGLDGELILAYDDGNGGVAEANDLHHWRAGWAFETGDKCFDAVIEALDFDRYAKGVVEDKTGKAQFVCEAVGVRPETNALDTSGYDYLFTSEQIVLLSYRKSVIRFITVITTPVVA